jgi:hypothetical protein
MPSCPSLAIVLLACFAGLARADSLLQVRAGEFCSPGSPGLAVPGTFDMRGIALPNWAEQARPDSGVVRQILQPMALHGLNTLFISLQGPGGAGRFFSADGRRVDETAGRAFTGLAFLTRDHGFALVVDVFSGDPRYRLESPEAYLAAARSLARLLPAKHSCVFIIAGLDGARPQAPDSPSFLRDPREALRLCEAIKQPKTDALVGLGANLLSRGPAGAAAPTLFYVGQSAEDLRLLLEPDPAAAGGRLVPCRDRWILRPGTDGADWDPAALSFMREVERERLAMARPPAVASGPAAVELIPADERREGFVPLFDGRSLEGWTTLTGNWGGWRVQDGAITCLGQTGPWLRTVRRYESFVLRLEFKIADRGNSGVFIHAPYDARASRFGMEVQIHGTRAEPPNQDCTGAIYMVAAPRLDASKPAGQWNSLEIVSRGTRLQITLNGQVVQDLETAQNDALKTRLKAGCIGLQDHGNPVSFRSIRIRELTPE